MYLHKAPHRYRDTPTCIPLLSHVHLRPILFDMQCPGLFKCNDMTSYAIRATLSLTAVGALLSVQPPRRPILAPTQIRNVTPSSRLKTNANGGRFDAGAWENMPTSNMVDKHLKPAVEDGAHVDLDIDQLPTFVFFADGGRRREDVVGGSIARACRAKLEAKLLSFSVLHGNDSLPVGEGTAATPRATDTAGAGNGIPSDTNIDKVGISAGVRLENYAIDNILEVPSREELFDIVTSSGRTAEQGPVVVMYHAPWCRKCAYLAPVFRHLATKQVTSCSLAEGSGDGENSWSRKAIFCRVDVSAWGGKAYRRTAAGRVGAASLVTRDIADTRANEGGARKSAHVGEARNDIQAEEEKRRVSLLHEGSPSMEKCEVCEGSGFVSCGECEGKGAVERCSSDGQHKLAVTCPACVGYKRLRCPACGGQCYMC